MQKDAGASTLSDLRDESTILLAAPTVGGGKSMACIDLLTLFPPADTSAIVATLHTDADRWMADLHAHEAEPPAALTVLHPGDNTRVPAALPDTPGTTEIGTIPEPADLAGLAMTISEYVQKHTDDRGTDDARHATVCFDSITGLLQYVGTQRAFRFIHALTSKIRSRNGTAHFHIDPDAHSAETVATMSSLFDVRLTAPTPDRDDWTIAHR